MLMPTSAEQRTLDRRIRSCLDRTLSGDSVTLPRRLRDAALAVWRLQAVVAQLPQQVASTSDSIEGMAVRKGLRRRSRLERALTRGLTAVLEVPADAEDYLRGGAKRSIRQHVAQSQRAGSSVRPVVDRDERLALVRKGDSFEAVHPNTLYRSATADHSDLLDVGHWFVAETTGGTPAVLAVLAVDGEWGLIRYLRVIDPDHAATSARYLMLAEIVRTASASGVRHIATDTSPINLASGLRTFQERVGFQFCRVRIR